MPTAGTGDRDVNHDELGDGTLVHALVDAAPDGILLTDHEGRILFANRQVATQFGYEPDELLHRSVEDLVPERLRPVHHTHRTRYRAEPRLRAMGAGLTLFGQRRDGSEFPVEISLSPFSTDDGPRIVAVVRDVTERLRQEAYQRQVREALDATRDAVLILDATTMQFTYANQGAVEQVGYARDELLQMTMMDIAPEFTEADLRELLGPMERREQSSLMFRTTHRRRDGSDVPVEILMQPLDDDENSAPTRYVKVARDVRERIETEERLRRAEQHLRLVEDRERIARDLHDVVIQKLFAAGLNVQSVAARSSQAEHARRLNHVVDDLDETIKEIRSVIFSLQSDEREGTGLRADVLRIADEEQPALGFAPHVRFEGPIDATGDAVAAELLPVVREALSNVARHAGASSVEVHLERAHNVVTLRVSDDGRGLPEIVESGHGLENLARRATKLGGRCDLERRPGGGTELQWQVPDLE